MSVFALVLAELRYRPWSAILALLIIAAATSAVVFFVGLSDLAASRTRIIQRDIGLNVRIIPEGTNLDRYWLKGYAEGSMDAALVERLEAQDVANRLVPMLQRTVPWGESEAILTGIGSENFKRGQTKKPVFGGLVKDSETLVLGALAAQMRDLSAGDEVSLLGRAFTVERVLSANGSIDDLRVHADLETVQQLLGMPGRLNEIRALECHCDESIEDPETYLRTTLEAQLPGTMVIRQDRMADARRKQRLLADRIGSVATPLLILLAATAVFGLAMLNAYQRRAEIGLLAAVGRSTLTIGLLVWLRSVLLGAIGGLLGAVLGAWIINAWGTSFVGQGPGKAELGMTWLLLGGLLGGTISSVGALVPAVVASRLDPASTLRGA